MDEKINADLKSLKFILNKNKSYIVPIVIILVSIMLFLQFVIPQFGALFTARKEAGVVAAKLEVLKANLDILTNINEETLDSQLKILNSALPLNKDFIGILNSVYSTAQKTGVDLGSFSFAIGDLSKSENSDNFPVVNLSIPINAGITVMNSFVEAISKTMPLSEIQSIKTGNVSSTINLSFYYKPVDTSGYSQDVSISSISQKGLTLIDQLGKFENASSASPPTVPVATSSGQ
jgi:hypothetical protein